MPELNFNALIPRQDFFQGYSEGQQQQNLLAQQAQARQLGDIQIKNAMREQQNAEAEAEAYKGAADLEDVRKRLMERGLGKSALALQKQMQEQKTAQLTQAKTQHELIKGAANQVFANPQAAQQILTNFSRQTGIDVADDLAQVSSFGNDPEKIRQWAAGIAIEADKLTPKFHSLTIPGKGVQTGTTDISGKFTPGELFAEQMSEYQKAQNKIAQQQANIAQQRANIEQQKLAQDDTSVVYQTDANGNVVALPSRLKAGEVPAGRTAVAPGGGFQPMMAKPSEAEGKEQMSINQQKSIVQGALRAIKETPDAFGYTAGSMPESLRGRLASPEENTNRSYLFNVVSGVIKERAGTAQSAAEAQTLARFLPTETDNADIIKSKLEGFDKYLTDKEAGTTKKRPSAAAKPVANPTANPYSSMSNEDLLKALRGK
jgi:hypothetical protein